MEHRVNDEKQADAESSRFTQQLVTVLPLEKIFRQVYTYAKFCEVQQECMKTLYVRPVATEKDDEDVLDITLKDRVWIHNKASRKDVPTTRTRQYNVKFNVNTKEAYCVCKLFECHGILCRHVITVYDMNDVEIVPEKFILSRWRKDIERKYTSVIVSYYDPSKTADLKRYDKLIVAFEPLCLDASTNEKDVQIVLEMIKKAKALVEERRAKDKSASVVGDNVKRTPTSVDTGATGTVVPNTPDANAAGINGQGLGTPGDRSSVNGIGAEETQFLDDQVEFIRDPPVKKRTYRTRQKEKDSCVEKPPPKKRKPRNSNKNKDGEQVQTPTNTLNPAATPPTPISNVQSRVTPISPIQYGQHGFSVVFHPNVYPPVMMPTNTPNPAATPPTPISNVQSQVTPISPIQYSQHGFPFGFPYYPPPYFHQHGHMPGTSNGQVVPAGELIVRPTNFPVGYFGHPFSPAPAEWWEKECARLAKGHVPSNPFTTPSPSTIRGSAVPGSCSNGAG